MKFLVDANLPRSLAHWIKDEGHESIHTFNLEKQNDTDDEEILDYLEKNPSILISKDSDFLKSFILKGKPEKLILITTGNIFNEELISIFKKNFSHIISLLETNKVIELSKENVISHF